MARLSFPFRPTTVLGLPLFGWLFALASLICGMFIAIPTSPTGGHAAEVSYLLQVACLAGVAYIAFSLRNFIAIEERVRTLPKSLVCDPPLFEIFRQYAEALNKMTCIPDPVFRNAALLQLATLGQSLHELGSGTLTFEGTESWRLIYEQILRSKVVYSYKSVAWVKDTDYWQDEPGQKSVRLNKELVASQQISIERIFIVRDSLWPTDSSTWDEQLTRMLDEQRKSGIKVLVIRESTLVNDHDLAGDFGIYGSHAVGYQIMDGRQQTNRFAIQFNFDDVAQAEQRWERLLVYAKPFEEILELPP